MTLRNFVNKKLASADKVAQADGYPLKLEDGKKYKHMRDLKIYGNSVQNGTPTPDNPIEVQSVGELVTDEADSNYGKYKIPVTTKGVNLWDKSNYLESTTRDTVLHDLYPTDYSFIKKGETITVSATIFVAENDTRTGTRLYIETIGTDNKAYGNKKAFYNAKGEETKVCLTYTIPEIDVDIGWLRIRFIDYSSNTENVWDAYVKDIQIEKGDTASDYEPYIEPVTTNIFLDEPLRKLGDYADYIDFKENKVVRRNKEVIPKPEDITYAYKSYASRYGYYIYGTGTKYPDAYTVNFNSWGVHIQPEKSTHFIANNAYSVSGVPGDWYIQTGIRFLLAPEFQASDGVSSTFDDIRAWMQSEIDKGTPLKFTYRLAEPTEEPLNMELPKLTAKTSIIEVDTSLTPSNTYGKYIKR